MRDASPLRYPGGKWRIASYLERLIHLNALVRREYVEPYAGGASLGLTLLFKGVVSHIHLNDLDPAIYSFWHSILNRKRDFIQLLTNTPITPDEWKKQKLIYTQGLKSGRLALGFATFFLNRTNHSGILNGGMIGGKEQTGKWKIDARFNIAELQRRIERIEELKARIHIYQEDALDLLRSRRFRTALKYLDPPYYRSGGRLYLNSYRASDHAAVMHYVTRLRSPWIVSYDDVKEIRGLYSDVRSRRMNLLHTARSSQLGHEVLFFSPNLRIPRFA